MCSVLCAAEALIPDPEVCADYWADFAVQAYSARHSIQERHPDTFKDTCPTFIHIDGTKMFKGSGQCQENIVYSASSSLVKLSSLKSKFILTQIPLHLMGKDTNSFIVFHLRWQWRRLKNGRIPRTGYYAEPLDDRRKPGQQWTGGKTALLAGIKTDAKEKQ